MNTLEGQQEWCKRPRKFQKTTEVVRPCEKNERGAHREKNVRCGHTREKKKRAVKPKIEISDACKRDMTQAGRKEDKAINRAKCRKKQISYTSDPCGNGAILGRRRVNLLTSERICLNMCVVSIGFYMS